MCAHGVAPNRLQSVCVIATHSLPPAQSFVCHPICILNKWKSWRVCAENRLPVIDKLQSCNISWICYNSQCIDMKLHINIWQTRMMCPAIELPARQFDFAYSSFYRQNVPSIIRLKTKPNHTINLYFYDILLSLFFKSVRAQRIRQWSILFRF